MTLFLTISGRCSPPSGTRRRGRTYRGLRFAHPRLSMVGPLRGPSANENWAGFCSGLSCWPAPRTLCKRKPGKFFAAVSHAGLLCGPFANENRASFLRRSLMLACSADPLQAKIGQAFYAGFSCWPALRTLCKRKSGKHFAAVSYSRKPTPPHKLLPHEAPFRGPHYPLFTIRYPLVRCSFAVYPYSTTATFAR